jgi:hypothetical protein
MMPLMLVNFRLLETQIEHKMAEMKKVGLAASMWAGTTNTSTAKKQSVEMKELQFPSRQEVNDTCSKLMVDPQISTATRLQNQTQSDKLPLTTVLTSMENTKQKIFKQFGVDHSA